MTAISNISDKEENGANIPNKQLFAGTNEVTAKVQNIEMGPAGSCKSESVRMNQLEADESSLKYQCLAQYFTAEEFEEMEDYEKESYLNLKENYEAATALGMTIGMPSFMKPKPLPVTKQPQKPKSSPKKSLSVNNSVSSMQLRKHSENAKKTLDYSFGSSDNDEATQNKENKDKSGEGLFQQTSNKESSTDASSTTAQPKKKRRRRRRQKPFEHLSEEAYAEKLPKFEIYKILESHGDPLEGVRKSLKEQGIVSGAQRKLMMRTLTKHLYFDEHGKVKRVNTDDKNGMAASIVREYPLFKDGTNPGKRSWWRIFDPAGPSGFLANCTTSIYRSMKPSERLRGGGRGSLVEIASEKEDDATAGPSTSNFFDKDAEWMGLTMPFESKKKELLQGMEASFDVRRKWIAGTQPSITEILSKYPHLMSYGTEMIEKEFNSMHPSKGPLFIRNFSRLVKLVKDKDEIAQCQQFEPEEANDVIGTCLTLSKKLPRPNLQRYKRMNESVMPKLETLIVTVPVGTNVENLVEQRRKASEVPVQPYLIALTPSKTITKLFLVADSKMLQLPLPAVLSGLDTLFKAYFVFNVHYPLGWKVFWEMVEHGLCQIEPHKLTNTSKELLTYYKFF